MVKLIEMKKLSLIALLCLLFACQENKTQSDSTQVNTDFDFKGRSVLVYTTADSTNYRLSLMDTV